MKHVDLTIVGGGFAGLACARRAAREGLSTVVLERMPEPGATVHTTGLLTQEALERLRPPDHLVRRIEGVRLYSPNLRHQDLAVPGYGFHASDTRGLLAWMAQQAGAAGADVRFGAVFRDAQRVADGMVIPSAGVHTRWLVGADGPRSRVARGFGLGTNTQFLVGVEAECCGVAPDVDRLHCLLDSELAPGYIGWFFTGVGGRAQVGLASRMPLQPDLDALVRKLGRRFDFRLAVRVERRGGLIPVGGALRRWHAPRVLLVGDAAGLVSPLTAGGIHTALSSGEDAAAAIAAHLRNEAPEPAVALAPLRPRFGAKQWLRKAIDLRPPNAWIDAALFNPVSSALAREILFHARRRSTRPKSPKPLIPDA